QGEPDEEHLLAMQKMLQKEIAQSSFLHGVRGERAGAHYLFENIRSGKATTNIFAMTMSDGGDPVSAWINGNYPSTMLRHYPEYLRHMNQIVAASKLPLPERGPKLKAIVDEGRQSGNIVVRMLSPALDKVEKADRRCQIFLRTMVVTLACERYR